MSSLNSGAAMPVWLTNGCTSRRPRQQLPHIGNAAGDRGRRRGGRARQMGAHFWPLAVLEIAIGGRHATLTGLAAVAVAAGAHRAAGFAPEEPGVAEYAVESRRLRLAFYARGAGHHHGDDAL